MSAIILLGCGLLFLATQGCTSKSVAQVTPQAPTRQVVTTPGGAVTNGHAVFFASYRTTTNLTKNPTYERNKRILASTNSNLPKSVIERIRTNVVAEFETNYFNVTNLVFQDFVPGTLSYVMWTNLTARTNGRASQMWSTRVHSPGWPNNGLSVKWNRRSLVYGMRGFTGLSPCWAGEGSSGQAPITALTRRHGYTRGHGMGAAGFHSNFAGKRVWFLAADDQLVEVKIDQEVVRYGENRDYTIVLFDRDLPGSIQPIPVTDAPKLVTRLPLLPNTPSPMIRTEQGGHAALELPGFETATVKGGDSGSPNLLLLGDQLVMTGGRSTSSPSTEMQADMDELCRKAHLDPAKYQMQWIDFASYPAYSSTAVK